MKSILGKAALVTGSASGIGRAISIALAHEGAELHLLDVDHKRLDVVANECSELNGGRVHRVVCDLSDSDDVGRVSRHLIDDFGGVDILVNNAGIVYYGPTANMTAAQRERLLAVNLNAPIQLTCELLPSMLERYESHVVNIASMYGLIAVPKSSVYHATKFGLVGFTDSLRREYGRHGVGVSAICPGMIQTNLFDAGASGYEHRDVPHPPSYICGTAEQVARKTLRAIRRDQRMALVTPTAYLASYLQRFAPWLPDALYRFGRRRKMKAKQARLQLDALENARLDEPHEAMTPSQLSLTPRS